MARQINGYATITEPDQPLVEWDTILCGHCQRIVRVKANSASTVYLIFDVPSWSWKEAMGAFCRVCMRPICLGARCLDHCLVWEKRLELSEARDRFRRQVLGQTTG